jgi:hypothetical protein
MCEEAVFGIVCMDSYVRSDVCSLMFRSNAWKFRSMLIVIFKEGIFYVILISVFYFNLWTYLTCVVGLIWQAISHFIPRGLI